MADFTFLSPGVKTREQDFSSYVAGLASSNFGMVGVATKGPIGVATFCPDAAAYIKQFGRPNGQGFGAYAAINTLAAGDSVWFTRVAGDSAKKGEANLGSGDLPAQAIAGTAFVSVDLTGTSDTGDFVITIGGVDYTLPFAIWSLWDNTSVNQTLEEFIAVLKSQAKNGASQTLSTVVELFNSDGKLGIKTKALGASASIIIDSVKNANCQDLLDMIGLSSVVTTTLTVNGTDGLNFAKVTALTEGTHAHDMRIEITEIGYYDPISQANDPFGFKMVIYDLNDIVEIWQCSTDPNSGNYFVDVIEGKSAWISIEDLQTGAPLTPTEAIKGAFADNSAYFSGGHDGVLPGVADFSTVIIKSEIGAEPEALKITSQGAGGVSNDIDVTIENVVNDNFDLIVVKRNDAGAGDDEGEVFRGLSTDPLSGSYVGNPANVVTTHLYDGTTNSTVDPAPHTSTLVSIAYLLTAATIIKEGNFQLSSEVPGLTDAAIVGSVADGGGLESFTNRESMDIDVLSAPGFTSPAVINKLAAVCESRGDCWAPCDVPMGLDAVQSIAWHNGQAPYDDHSAFNSSHISFYWAWQAFDDPFTGKEIWLPPTAFVLNRVAYTDAEFAFHEAVAGMKRGRLVEAKRPEFSPLQGEMDLLYSGLNRINPIANFTSEGSVIWGNLTALRTNSQLNRVPTRRMVAKYRKVIAATTRYLVFDKNNRKLWGEFTDMVSRYLETQVSDGALFDFRVKMDSQTVTPDKIANHEAPGQISIKVEETAEFFPITFTLTPRGASFDNSAAQGA